MLLPDSLNKILFMVVVDIEVGSAVSMKGSQQFNSFGHG